MAFASHLTLKDDFVDGAKVPATGSESSHANNGPPASDVILQSSVHVPRWK